MNSITNGLKVAMLPVEICLGDKAANINAVECALQKLPAGTDIVVLPELFTTGYFDDEEKLKSLAERNTQRTVDILREWAAKYNCAFVGTFLASTPPHIYNRAFFIEPCGDETFYDKAHLFGLSSEAKILRPGVTRPPIVRFRCWNVGFAVCYDLRFPVWLRNCNYAYDIFLLPCNWPEVRSYDFQHLLIARAIENQAPFVGANRGGKDQYGNYDGMTFAYNSKGRPVALSNPNSPWIIAEFSLDEVEMHRKKFPVLADADKFSLG